MDDVARVVIIALCVAAGASYLIAIAVMQHLRRSIEQVVSGAERTGLHSALGWLPGISRMVAEIEAPIQHLAAAKRDTDTRYAILTENVAAAVMLHEADGAVSWVSPFTEVLTGFSTSEIYAAGRDFMPAHIHEEDREILEKSLAIVATGEPFQCRFRFYHKSGIPLWLETRTVPIWDEESHEYVALSISIDVTASALNQLQIEERNRDLHEFTYMISHDLKAPLITIRGMLGILQDDRITESVPSSAEPLTYITKAVSRLEELVSGILELARVSAATKVLEPQDIDSITRDVIDDLHPETIRRSASIELGENLPKVLGDKLQLYQIISNLIGNALKYGDPSRPLKISVRAQDGASRRRVCLVIQDNGQGIPAEKLKEIFEPFKRGEQSTGNGVGLACVKRLVEKNSGDITVESEFGVGTTFTVQLRRAL